jgi:hypothetical protein
VGSLAPWSPSTAAWPCNAPRAFGHITDPGQCRLLRRAARLMTAASLRRSATDARLSQCSAPIDKPAQLRGGISGQTRVGLSHRRATQMPSVTLMA